MWSLLTIDFGSICRFLIKCFAKNWIQWRFWPIFNTRLDWDKRRQNQIFEFPYRVAALAHSFTNEVFKIADVFRNHVQISLIWVSLGRSPNFHQVRKLARKNTFAHFPKNLFNCFRCYAFRVKKNDPTLRMSLVESAISVFRVGIFTPRWLGFCRNLFCHNKWMN